ncbi:MAG TPA: hypothetical protein VJY14_01155, partial [Aliarcobacter sp.]|nr:hypothetical protein [Aliarcobacter sp.]
ELVIDSATNATISTTAGSATATIEDNYNPTDDPKDPTGDKPILIITGSTVTEKVNGVSTGDKVVGTVEISIENGKVFAEDLTITLSNGKEVVIKAGETTTGPIEIETNRIDDYYKQGTTTYNVSIQNVSNSKIDITNKTASITINDDVDPTTVTISGTAIGSTIIDSGNVLNNTGFTVTAYDMNGNTVGVKVGVINELDVWGKGDVSGFGVLSAKEKAFLESKGGVDDIVAIKASNNSYSGKEYDGATAPEINVSKDGKNSESLVVDFEGKEIRSLDVALAFRNSGEKAELVFKNGDEIVGYARISGGGIGKLAKIEYFSATDTINPVVTKYEEGGSDLIDKTYKFEPAGGVTFDKVIFKGIDSKDSYLINSISYKEVLDSSSTNYSNAEQVRFDIQTSNVPDPTIAKPTATVQVGDKTYTVDLDKNGYGSLTLPSEGLTSLTATVIAVNGNFEKVEVPVSTTISTTANPKADKDEIIVKEDIPYTLKTTDFGDNNQNVAKIKFDSTPANGTIYVLKTEYTGSVNDKAEYSESTKQFFDEIKAGDIVDISKIENGNVVFVPNKDTDADSSFNFSVSSGNGNFSGNYTTDIIVKAVADAPEVSIKIEDKGTTTISTGNSGNGNSGSNTKIEKLAFEEYKFAQEPSNATVINTNDSNYTNANAGNDTIKFTGTFNNGNTVNTGAGDDYVYFNQTSNVTLNLGEGNNQAHFNQEMKGSIKASSGNDEVRINQSINKADIDLGAGNNKLYIKNISNGNNGEIKFGDGSDKLVIDGSADNTNISLGRGNNIVSIKGNYGGTITSEDGNDTIIIGGNINNQNSKINTGAGNDFVQIHGEINNQFGKVDLGEGDDGFRYEPTNWNAGNQNAIDGGKGFDTLYLKGNSTDYYVYTKDENIGKQYGKLHDNGGGIYMISWETFAKLNEDSEGFAQKEFYITKNYYNTNMALKVTNFESISFDDKTIGDKVDTTTVYKYDISLSAQLTDTDGSEELSDITLKNIPEGSELFGADKQENGTYTVEVDETGKAKLTLESKYKLSEDELNSIKASATSTENSNGDSATTTVSQNLGNDIDLSGLTSILEEQKTGDIDLSKNGSQDKLTLTLDDVLKLSGDDKQIKITGDEFDSVAFKNEDGKAWKQETSITENNKKFDVYSGSIGDQTVQVKVEQPISDGITN